MSKHIDALVTRFTDSQDAGALTVRALASELAAAERDALRLKDPVRIARVIDLQQRLTEAVRTMPVRVGLGR